MTLGHFEKRLLCGLYFRNEQFSSYVSRNQNLETLVALKPNHVRLLFKPYMWDHSMTKEEIHQHHQLNISESQGIVWTEKGLIAGDEDLSYNFRKEQKKNKSEETTPETKELESPTLDKPPSPTPSEGDKSPLLDLTLPMEAAPQHPTFPLEWEDLKETLSGVSIIIGMHPDQAAEAIVDFALASKIPFALTPCCVYSQSFPTRKLKSGKFVKTYQDLIDYLVEKDAKHILTTKLDFEGRNVVVYWNPTSSPASDETLVDHKEEA